MNYEISKQNLRKLILKILPILTFFLSAIFLFKKYGLTADFFSGIYLMAILIIVSFIDIYYRIIPDSYIIAGLVGSCGFYLYSLFSPVVLFNNYYWWSQLMGLIAGSGIFFLIFIVGLLIYKSDEAMGMGDVKLIMPIGLLLGLKLVILTIILTFILAGTICFFLLVFRIKDKKDTIPFAPFITLSTFIILLFGMLPTI